MKSNLRNPQKRLKNIVTLITKAHRVESSPNFIKYKDANHEPYSKPEEKVSIANNTKLKQKMKNKKHILIKEASYSSKKNTDPRGK